MTKTHGLSPGLSNRTAVLNPLLTVLLTDCNKYRLAETYVLSRRGEEPYPNKMNKLKYMIEKGKEQNLKKSCLDCLVSSLSGLKECYL